MMRDQTLDLQKDALEKAGCTGLNEALKFLKEGDVLVVWPLDRLGCSLKNLIDIISLLQQRGIGFKSISENIDTTTPGGKLIFHIFLVCWPSLSVI